MSGRRLGSAVAVFVAAGLAGLAARPAMAAAEEELAREILKATAVRGGLVVHVGCGDGRLTAALRAGDAYLVQGLDTDAANVAAAREHLQSLGVYGKVAVDTFDGVRLPYADNLANLVVSEDLAGVAMAEVMRVLAPLGTAYVKTGGKWTKTVKPRPAEIDEWTHFLHGPDNNAVAADTVVGPPTSYQWTAGPLWARSHEIRPSIRGMVTAAGRLFYLHDEGPIGIFDERFPEKWSLIARDAFNGTLLWKRRVPPCATGIVIWLRIGVDTNRTLVASGERVYLAQGADKPVCAFDAATGAVVREYPAAPAATEIILHDGVLLAVSSADKPGPRLTALQAEGGDLLWEKPAAVAPLSLAACADWACYHDGSAVVCVDLKTGKERWRQRASRPEAPAKRRRPPRQAGVGPVVARPGQVLVAGGRSGSVMALSAKDGTVLWTWRATGRDRPPSFSAPFPVFAANGLIWPGVLGVGLDPATGEVKQTVNPQWTAGHHHRCHLQKATTRFLLASKRGIEFVPIREGDRPSAHDWVRGTCKLGVVPANGLLYFPHHGCFCYPGAKLRGMNALASRREEPLPDADAKLERAPASGPAGAAEAEPDAAAGTDWPTYRHDPARSGTSPTAVPHRLKQVWARTLGGRLTPPVIAAGKVFLATVDSHQVHALDAVAGAPVWRRTVGGRVDSPPTFHQGRLLLGCRDGWVYCLRAADGQLAWRFRAAPRDRRIGAFDQVESAWPVHGSVLVQAGVAYFAAGRSSFLDGGIFVYALDARSGKVLHRARLHDADQGTSKAFDLPAGSLPDVFVGDGVHVYMGRSKFDAALRLQDTPEHDDAAAKSKGVRDVGLHLMSTSGLLDDTHFARAFWTYSRYWPGYTFGHLGPRSGQLLTFDAATTYGVKIYEQTKSEFFRSPFFTPGSGCTLYADDNRGEPDFTGKRSDRWSYTRTGPPKWSVRVPLFVRAMVSTRQHLFVAGPPDVVDAEYPLAALEARKGAALWAVCPGDGTKLAELPLQAPPVFDGLAAANERLYMTGLDGRLLCFGGP